MNTGPFRRLLPYCILAFAAIVFHRRVLFDAHTTFPWDFQGHHLPLATAYADSLSEGVLPLWEPYAYCGRPLLANPQTAVFYPPMALAASGGRHGLVERLEWMAVLHVILAGIFVYILCRRIGLPGTAALAAGGAFELGPFFASQAQHLSSVFNGPWLALSWLSLWLPAAWRIPALSAALALSWFAGFTGFTLTIFASTLLLSILLCACEKRAYSLPFEVCAAAALSAALAFVQLGPTLELVEHSVGKYRTDWLEGGGGIPFAALASMLVPNFHGVFDPASYRSPHELTHMYLYCGLTGLALAAAGMCRASRVWAWLCGASLLLMLGDSTFIGKGLVRVLPDFIRRGVYWYLFMSAFALSLAVLAGYGVSRLKQGPWVRALLATALTAELVLAGSGRAMNSERLAMNPAALGPAERRLRQLAAGGRIDTMDNGLPLMALAPVMKVRTANGYDPLALERLIQLRLTCARGKRWGAYYQIENSSCAALAAMAVRLLSTNRELPEAAAAVWNTPQSLPGRILYVARRPPQRFRAVSRAIGVKNRAEAARLMNGGFDPATEALVEGWSGAGDARGASVTVLQEARNTIVLRTHSAQPVFLATSEAWYPAWRATLDGDPARLYATNVAFRGLPVPGGTHTIVFTYSARSLFYSAVVSAGAWLAWWGLALRARRRASAGSELAARAPRQSR